MHTLKAAITPLSIGRIKAVVLVGSVTDQSTRLEIWAAVAGGGCDWMD
jgi:hypothetical protein